VTAVAARSIPRSRRRRRSAPRLASCLATPGHGQRSFLLRHNRTREVDGPFLPTIMEGIQASLDDLAREASSQPNSAAPHSPALNFCLLNPNFTMDHLRTSGAQSAATIPCPAKAEVTTMVTSLFRQVATIRGNTLCTVAWSLVFLFPTLVLGPHRPGAPSSVVKVETEAWISLWQRGELHTLASRATTARMERPHRTRNKKARVAKRATALLRHNQYTRAARLSHSKGVADASHDTSDAILALFKESCVVDEESLRPLYGPRVTPTRESTSVTITVEDVYKCLAEVAPLTTPHKYSWHAGHLLALCKDADCGAAFTDVIAALVAGDITDDTCDLLSSATNVVLMKKSEEEMEALKLRQGQLYMHPTGLLGWAAPSRKLRQTAS